MSDLEASAPLLARAETTSDETVIQQKRNRSLIQAFLILIGATGGALVLFGAYRYFEGDNSAATNQWPLYREYEGPTKTGSEALAAATGYPSTPYPISPPANRVNLLEKLGNLSPWHSVNHGMNTTAQVPVGCTLNHVSVLHRHGARGTAGSDSGCGKLEAKFSKTKANRGFKGEIAFLNQWKYSLSQEILTNFGRQQLFDLGVKYRVNYGSLFSHNSSTSSNLPVFRTTSQNRMLQSALNFAAGFFGLEYQEKYHQEVVIEAEGFNNTLAPYMTCTNANRNDLALAKTKVTEWKDIYLKDAVSRFNKMVDGYEFSIQDAFDLQDLCGYELVALGASEACNLFKNEEWDGYEYALDLIFYYEFSFGQPAQAAIGKGYVEEFISRITGERITKFDSTTNSTLHTEEYFPLNNGQTFFVDATHDTIISAVLTTLNFNSFAGSLPSTHIPKNRNFITSKISPFAANLHAQIMTCDSNDSPVKEGSYIRWILNDGVVPLDGTKGCGTNQDGMCELETFIKSTKERLNSIDFDYDCFGDYTMPEKEILDGRPPKRL